MNTMKRLIRFGISLLVLSGFILLLGAVESARGKKSCERLVIEVDHSSGVYFLHKKDVRAFLKDREDSLVGRKMGDIDLHELEASLGRIPEVKEAEAFQELDGTLRVSIEQRKPIARFISDEGMSFYWDRKGKKMPLSRSFTPRVPVVTGNGDDPIFSADKGHEKREKLQELLTSIHADPFWKKQIQELHVNEDGGLEFVPLVGGHRVIFGALNDSSDKLKKLRVFYREASQHTGLAQYDTLDLRFGDQVVGKKKDHGGI